MRDGRFDKYELMGAYHWDECNPRSPRFNPPLVARYAVVTSRIEAADRVLDMGCGDGYLLGQLAARCRGAVGIEFEPAAVELAVQKLSSCERCAVLRGSVYALPFADREFDVVVMADVIEHLEDPGRAVSEAARVLKPAGRLMVTTPKWRPDRRWDSRHVREYRPEELRDCLAAVFDEVRLRYFWPSRWSSWYSSRIGWKLIKWYARCLPNPFIEESGEPEGYGQILALARRSG